jgi:hypothetical protein
MSTILDALRKVERDKKAAHRKHTAHVDDATAARELVGGYNRKATLELSAKHLMLGLGLAAFAIIGVSVGLSSWVASPTADVQVATVTPVESLPIPPREEEPVVEVQNAVTVPEAPLPPPVPPAPPVSEQQAPVSAPVTVAVPDPIPTPPASAADDVTAGAIPAVVSEDLAPEAVLPEPEVTERQYPLPQEPMVVATAPEEPVNVQRVPYDPSQRASLPLMNETDKRRHGLGDMKINMVRPVNDNNPYASAIINLVPVQIGESIPNSTVRLIGVDIDGIVVETVAAGERYVIRVL